jgi:hypothetical protein
VTLVATAEARIKTNDSRTSGFTPLTSDLGIGFIEQVEIKPTRL